MEAITLANGTADGRMMTYGFVDEAEVRRDKLVGLAKQWVVRLGGAA